MKRREYGGGGDVRNGTRTNDSTSRSQEYVQIKKNNNNNKEKEILAWQGHGGLRIWISFAVFTFQLRPLSKTSVMSSSSI